MNIFDCYEKINLQIIKSVEEDNEDIELFGERQKIIEEILSLSIGNDMIKKQYLDRKLDMLDKRVEEVIKEKMVCIKRKLKELDISKKANVGYGNVNRIRSLFSETV